MSLYNYQCYTCINVLINLLHNNYFVINCIFITINHAMNVDLVSHHSIAQLVFGAQNHTTQSD